MILVAPGAIGFPGLAAAHLFLGMHAESGAWKITAGAKIEVDDEVYKPGESAILRQPKTSIEVLGMQYSVRFEIDSPQSELDYIQQRDEMLRGAGIPLPHTAISGIPMRGDNILDSIVFRQGIGSGTFGSVWEGFDPKTGQLRVAKRIILKSAQEAPLVEREIKALERFNEHVGIIQLIEWRTSLNGKNLVVPHYPLAVDLIHKKGAAFHQADWNVISWEIRRVLCYQLLLGLKAIHGAGCMHRDITPMNLLVFPHGNIPQATLCDFGKFCSTATDVDTKLAAWQFLPPELQKDQKNLYDQKLDIWMLALSLTYTWWPQTKHLRPRSKTDHKNMRDIRSQDKGQDRLLGELLADMMSWDPSKRPTAVEALKHKSLRECPAVSQEAAQPLKRPYDDNDTSWHDGRFAQP